MTMHADNQPLTIEEQILLSASIDAQDGELTAAEHAQVQALLQRPQARAYVDSLRATRVLVGRHGAAKAPVGLKGRVLAALDEDFDDISRPTASRDGKVIAMPSASWRTPVFALAAAVLVTLGVFFGPSLIPSDKPASPADVARERLNNTTKSPQDATGDGHWGADKSPTGADSARESSDASRQNALRLAQDAADEANEDSPDNDPANAEKSRRVEDYRRARNGNSLPNPAEELGKGGRTEQPGNSGAPETADVLKDDASKKKKDLTEHDAEGTEGKEPAKSRDEGGGGGKSGSSGGAGEQPPARPELDRKVGSKQADAKEGRPAPEDSNNGPKAENRGDDGATEGKLDESRQAKDPAPNKPASPAQGSAQDDRDQAEKEDASRKAEERAFGEAAKLDRVDRQVELSLQPGSVLSAQTDVLRIAALYGEAKLLDQVGADQAVESVVVELDEAKVAELVAALQRMAQRQEYGELKVPAALKPTAEPAADLAKVGDTARDSLPSEVKVRLAGQTASPPAEPGTAPVPAPKAPAGKVRLTINLK